MKRRLTYFLAAVMTCLTGCNDRPWSSGDRVLVSKFVYDSHLVPPSRFDVVVFKYPRQPVEGGIPKNYIKRLWGLPGEILAIFFGRVFAYLPPAGQEPVQDNKNPNIDPNNLWKSEYRHDDAPELKDLFNAGKLQIVRKPPDVLLAMRRIVYDNDFQAKSMKDYPRWTPGSGSGWTPAASGKTFSASGAKKDGVDWLRYQHLTRPWYKYGTMKDRKPELITDFMDYNGEWPDPAQAQSYPLNILEHSWVGDLMLECDVNVAKAEGEFWMELSKGIQRFRAKFDLSTGQCSLFRVLYSDAGEEKVVPLDQKPTKMKAPGTYMVRFANIDARLAVWVDRELPFGEGKEYPVPEIRNSEDELEKAEKGLSEAQVQENVRQRRGPRKNDLEPASIGVSGAQVEISHVRLWRDSYFTQGGSAADSKPNGEPGRIPPLPPEIEADPNRRDQARAQAENKARFDFYHQFYSEPSRWEPIRRQSFRLMYVQPGHYLCLGDNSTHSSDSREWGTVPERLMLGRALMVYFPLDRAGPIR